MALYVKDPEVDRMAERLSRIARVSKTEAVRRALRRELDQVEQPDSLAARIDAFMSALDARAPIERGLPIDKAFIDSLYERD